MDKEHHPFYKHSEADFILVESGRKTLGRVAVLHHKNFCEFHKTNTAFFFYYEAVDDQEVANLLISTAEEWCKERQIDELYGPRGFLRSNCIGLLVEGFDQQPATGMDLQPALLPGTARPMRFREKHGSFFRSPGVHIFDRRIHGGSEKKVLSRGNFVVQNFKNKSEMEAWIPKIEVVERKAFAEILDYIPSTQEEFELLARNIIAIADPKYIKMILHGDEVAGFLIAYPNINRGLRFARGTHVPIRLAGAAVG